MYEAYNYGLGGNGYLWILSLGALSGPGLWENSAAFAADPALQLSVLKGLVRGRPCEPREMAPTTFYGTSGTCPT